MLAQSMRKNSAALLCMAMFACALSAQTLVSATPDAGSASAAQPAWSALPAATPSPAAAARTTNYFVYERARGDAWKWFAAPPYKDEYRYLQSLFRAGITHRDGAWDWELEMEQAAVLDAPSDSVSSVTAQGQMGIGASYYASSGDNSYPAAASFKQGFVRYSWGDDRSLRLGRFEFFDGVELHPKDPQMLWLQNNRMQQRLIGNFGFSNALRSFDGGDAHFGSGNWDVTAMAGRADQGVFNMNANPELNVDLQYLAYSRSAAHGHVIARGFAIGYHDGRTNVTKGDNRPLAVRQADHDNIRLGTYGGDLMATAPAGPGAFDFVFWGAYQNGSWGTLSDSAGAATFEGGYRLSTPTNPWLRGGWLRSTGDTNPGDGTHNTFFQVLPTPRVYARLPFYNFMNSTDDFVQLIDKPAKKLELRSEVHWLRLTSGKDGWYSGGGAYDNKVFGFTPRPGNGFNSLASDWDISSDWQASNHFNFDLYYGYGWGKTVVRAIYPTGPNVQLGYAELIYRWGKTTGGSGK
jgi:Alginate export